MVKIRPEEPGDIDTLFTLNSSAFGREAEAKLVDSLRGNVYPYVSLVAELGGDIIGHILFTPVSVGNAVVRAAGLGPMAVTSRYRGKGIGASLVEEGLKAVSEHGFTAVFVLGEPEYYMRFGFEPAADKDIFWKSDEFAPYFFSLELVPGALDRVSGEVVFHPAFGNV